MLVLPVVGMLVLFGILVSRESDEYLETNAVSQEVRLSLTVQNMIHELQRERGLTAGLLGGDTRFRPDLVEQRRQTDDARAVLDSALAHTDVSARDTVRTALGSLDNQDKVRATVDAGTANQNATFDFYTAAVDALSVDLTTSDVGDLTLREHLASLRTLGDAKEALARERGFLSAVFAAGRFTGDEYVRFAGIRAARLAALEDRKSVV